MTSTTLVFTPVAVTASTVLGGSITIAANNTIGTVTHGGGAEPSWVNITWVNDIEGRGWWVTDRTNTTFLLHLSSIGFGELSFFWSAGFT